MAIRVICGDGSYAYRLRCEDSLETLNNLLQKDYDETSPVAITEENYDELRDLCALPIPRFRQNAINNDSVNWRKSRGDSSHLAPVVLLDLEVSIVERNLLLLSPACFIYSSSFRSSS